MASQPGPTPVLVLPDPRVARPDAAERRRFAAEVGELELRLAVLDDRFDALARRSPGAYALWRGDTVARTQRLASRTADLERRGCLTAGERPRVAALLVTLRNRVAALDVRHAELRG